MNRKSKYKRNSTALSDLSNKWIVGRSGISSIPGEKRFQNKDYDDDDDESLDFLNSSETGNWEEDFFGVSQKINEYISMDALESEIILNRKQTHVIATLVPDMVIEIERFDVKDAKKFVGVLLLADVSGFTPLSERYNNTGKGGTYRLTATLNAYLGALVELIYGHGGDVLKFAGDAFLAVWRADKNKYLSHTIHKVITCAYMIQHTYGIYETDVKVNLKVKLAISAGNMLFSPIGDDKDKNFIVTGVPVSEAKEAESMCTSGDIVISPSAWGHCYTRNYDFTIERNNHVKLISILYDIDDFNLCKPFNRYNKPKTRNKTFNYDIENFPEHYWGSSTILDGSDRQRKEETINIRPKVAEADNKKIGGSLRNFMIRPVVQQIDAHQPLEYLTEMRQVTIMFITLTSKVCKNEKFILIVDNAYQITSQMVYMSMGCVNKIILFDKDIMILVIFGLRGFKHESEAQAGLKCAYGVRKSLSELDGVTHASIGVTTGQVYCGVVGHPLRREFTVIGAAVNMAARLMCAFRDRVTCDESTFVKSKLSSYNFLIQEKIQLKGINDCGKLYEYTEEIRAKKMFDIDMILPLLNRSDEMEHFQNVINPTNENFKQYTGLLLIGENRIGKSCLLEHMIRYARNNDWKVISISLTSIHVASPYSTLSQIFNGIFDTNEENKNFAREEKIVSSLNRYNEDLCYLNNILRLKFPYNHLILQETDDMKIKKALKVLECIILTIKSNLIITLDDIQNLDPQSWPFIKMIIETKKALSIMTLVRGRFSNVDNWIYDIFIDNNIRKIRISNLDSYWLAPLACQVLHTAAVPSQLCNILKKKCQSSPGLVESFLTTLYSNEYIGILNITKDQISNATQEYDLIFPDQSFLKPIAFFDKDQHLLEKNYVDSQEIYVCIIKDSEAVQSNLNSFNIDAMIMTQIDMLTPYQQLMLKIASVIGESFSREFLVNIMYDNDIITTARAVRKLFSMKFFTCGNVVREKNFNDLSSFSFSSIHTGQYLRCNCDLDCESMDNNELPKYAFCNYIRFKSKIIRQTCYELLPINQKKEFHARIINYLEGTKHKCIPCGGNLQLGQSYRYTKSSFNYLPLEIDQQEIKLSYEKNFDENESYDSEDTEIRKISNRVSNITSLHNYGELSSSNENNNYYEKLTQNTNISNNTVSLLPLNKDDLNKKIHKLDYTKSGDELEPTSILKPTRFSDINIGKNNTQKRVTLADSKTEPLKTILNLNKIELNRYHVINEKEIKKQNDESSSKNTNSTDSIDKETSFFIKLREITEAGSLENWKTLGFDFKEENILEQKKKNIYPANIFFSIHIRKGDSKIDFSTCKCLELAVIIYEQLVHHSIQADLKEKTIIFLINYCEACLLAGDAETSLDKLEEAENRCRENIEDKKSETFKLNNFSKKLFFGKIFSLKAQCHVALGDLSKAKLYISKALKKYGYRANVSGFIGPSQYISYIKQKWWNKIFSISIKKDSKKEILHRDLVFCLTTALSIYSVAGELRSSKLISKLIRIIVKNCQPNIVDVCNAFSLMIHLALQENKIDRCIKYEKEAYFVISVFADEIKGDELWAVGKLFSANFTARLARGNLAAATRAGFRAVVIARFIAANDVLLEFLPELFQVLLNTHRIPEAIDLLRELTNVAKTRIDLEYETWYYALCLDLILDIGVQLEPIKAIMTFATAFASHNRFKLKSLAIQRLITNVWAYWLRTGKEDRSILWEDQALSQSVASGAVFELSFRSLVTSMRLIEGMLVKLSKKMDEIRKLIDIVNLHSLAERELATLEYSVRSCRAVLPRWFNLRAFSAALSKRERASFFLDNAKLAADKNGDLLESDRVLISRSLWLNSPAECTESSQLWENYTKNFENAIFPPWQQASRGLIFVSDVPRKWR